MENENESEDAEYETREVLDDEKLVDELEKWHENAYEINKLDFFLIASAFAIAPPLLPLWFAVSLGKHFSGKDLRKTEKYKVVDEE